MGIDKDGIRNFTGGIIAGTNQLNDPNLYSYGGNAFYDIITVLSPGGIDNTTLRIAKGVGFDPSRAVPTANDNRVLTASSIKWRRTN